MVTGTRGPPSLCPCHVRSHQFLRALIDSLVNSKSCLIPGLYHFQIIVLAVQMGGAPCTISTPQETARTGNQGLPYTEISEWIMPSLSPSYRKRFKEAGTMPSCTSVSRLQKNICSVNFLHGVMSSSDVGLLIRYTKLQQARNWFRTGATAGLNTVHIPPYDPAEAVL